MDLAAPDTPRWVQRFANFDRAILLLRDGVTLWADPDVPASMRDIVREGTVQRFEFTWELAWQTLKDFLLWKHVRLDKITPGEVIKTAFAAGYIEHGQDWMDALEARNLMSHTYRRATFVAVTEQIAMTFLPRLEELHDLLMEERSRLDEH